MRQISDNDYSINELMSTCLRDGEKRGWHEKPITFSEATSLLHTEISEAFEEFRNNHKYNEIYCNPHSTKPEGIPIEFADLAIRLFHYSAYFGIDLIQGIREKLEYNRTRPHRHGGKQC